MLEIKYMSWTDFDKTRKETDTVIIPSGAIEVYGPHMPLGSDTIVAEEISKKVAERTNALIGPTVGVGESLNLGMFPGTMVIKPENFKNYMEDIFVSLINWGFKNFMFINMHAGNVPIIAQLCREYQRSNPGIKCAQVDWWRFTAVNGDDIFENKGYMAHGHASECGTSVMLYLRPELVHLDRLERVVPKTNHYKEFTDIIKYTAFEQFTESGVIGDATIASKVKGEKIVERCVDRIVEYMKKEFK